MVTTDALVEGVHFDRTYAPLGMIGWKAIASSVSDVVAMNATPRFATVTLGMPNNVSVENAETLYDGISAACDRYGLADDRRRHHGRAAPNALGHRDRRGRRGRGRLPQGRERGRHPVRDRRPRERRRRPADPDRRQGGGPRRGRGRRRRCRVSPARPERVLVRRRAPADCPRPASTGSACGARRASGRRP